MTAEEINALPEKIRKYICDLETRADPAGEVRINRQLADVNRELVASNRMLRDTLDKTRDSLDGLAMCISQLQDELRNR